MPGGLIRCDGQCPTDLPCIQLSGPDRQCAYSTPHSCMVGREAPAGMFGQWAGGPGLAVLPCVPIHLASL